MSDYWDRKLKYETIEVAIDELTWSDLDMDDVFKRIDTCLTSVGDEVLYATLHEPRWDEKPLRNRDQLIAFFEENAKERLEIQMILSKLGKTSYNDVSSLIFESQTKALKNPMIYTVMGVIPFLCIGICFINPGIGVMSLIASIILNGGIYYYFKKEIAKNLLTIQYFAAILRCCSRLSRCETKSCLKVLVDQIEEAYIPFKTLSGKLSGVMMSSDSDIDLILDYLKIMTLYDFRIYNKAIALVSKNRVAFHSIYQNIGELDMSIALASFRKSLAGTVTPTFTEVFNINACDLYHPLLKSPVPNDIMLRKNSLITGSNASGKSTFVKALAINSIFAQTIYTCTASSFSLTFCLPITAMAVRDDILVGDSYFMAEIKSLKRTIDQIKNYPCLCFIDEILKGTNTIERIAASSAILEYFDRQNCLCLIATHDIELTNILANSYDNYHFKEAITDDSILFDYQLHAGPAQTKNAIALLNHLEFDQTIIRNAYELVDAFTETEKWPVFV
ncbi:DNA mismatch repair protein MutS [Acetobacterium wieringae]|uniref:MutS-related protein n=1 Tax=Acetobacterium wieringae TaxID=52694 RepID=UPI0026EF4381|nr:DNA mismatch repair protein MutS [Acetobacterium wieringae]